MNTHYGLIMFSGDYDNDHPDEELRGSSPRAQFIAAGDEESCWRGLQQWTASHPLRRGETAEVVRRSEHLVAAPTEPETTTREEWGYRFTDPEHADGGRVRGPFPIRQHAHEMFALPAYDVRRTVTEGPWEPVDAEEQS